jgi:hypothetical protein
MKPALTMLVLTGVLICMFGVVWSQNSSTSNSNAARNSNAVNRHGGNPYAGIPCAPYATSNVGCDPNAGYNAANVDWNVANYAANMSKPGVTVQNTNAPRKAPPRKKRTRRPTASLGGAFTFKTSLSAMLAAGVL